MFCSSADRMDCSDDDHEHQIESKLKNLPSDIVLHSILCHYILDLDRYAFLYKKYKSDLLLLFMGRVHGQIHLIFKNVSLSTYRAIGRDGLVFNFMKSSDILDQILPSRLQSIDFMSNYFTREDSLVELPPIICNHADFLRKINLSRQASFKAFDQLVELFSNLEEFKISDTRLPIEKLIKILAVNKNLKSIEYSNPIVYNNVGEEGGPVVDVPLVLTSIVALENLTSVNLSGVKFVNSQFVDKLFVNLPLLSELLIRYCTNVTDLAFVDIEKHQNIKIVDISGCQISYPSRILANPNIRKLCYEDSDFTIVEFNLTSMSNVLELSFSLSTNISPQVLKNLAQFCSNLEVLRLDNTTYQADALLTQFLSTTNPTTTINNLTKLRELYLNGTKLTDQHVKVISQQVQNLQTLSLEFNDDITDASIIESIIDNNQKLFSKLRDLRLGRTLITHHGISALLSHYKDCGRMIENLALNSLKLTGEKILSIPHWNQVQKLNLSKNKINNEAFLYLISPQFSNIIELNCADNLITNEGVHPHLYSNKTLQKLNLTSNRNISTRTKSSIVMKCSNISDLSL